MSLLDFRRALDDVAEDRTVVVELPAPPAPLLRFLAVAPRGHGFLWQPPAGAGLAGAWVAHLVEGRGEARFAEVRRAADGVFARLERRALPGADAPPPVLVGGLAFAPGAADDAPWSELGDAAFTLPRWCSGGGWLSFAAPGSALRDAAARDAATAELAAILDGLARPDAAEPAPSAAISDVDDRVAWAALVDAIVGEIAAGRLEKAVAARRLHVTAGAGIDDLAVARRLAAAAPACTTFAFRRAASTFLGATPERLVTRRGRRVVAEALAGTIAVGAADADALLGSDKDLREHVIVVRAIAAALAPFCAHVDHPSVPEVHTLRDMLHLRTPIVGELHGPTHVLTLVEALHPTPAVGGVPREAALRLLAAAEAPRGWYAAPIGWFDARGDGELCVALRCGVVAGRDAVAYAGAGIVAGSDAEREHAETALKLRTLLGALGVGE